MKKTVKTSVFKQNLLVECIFYFRTSYTGWIKLSLYDFGILCDLWSLTICIHCLNRLVCLSSFYSMSYRNVVLISILVFHNSSTNFTLVLCVLTMQCLNMSFHSTFEWKLLCTIFTPPDHLSLLSSHSGKHVCHFSCSSNTALVINKIKRKVM